MRFHFASLVVFAAAVAGVSAPAFAAPSGTRIVRTSDLNLATEQGVDALHARLRRASEAVCGGYETGDLQQRVQFHTCKKAAFTRASTDAQRIVMNSNAASRSAMAVSSGVTAAR